MAANYFARVVRHFGRARATADASASPSTIAVSAKARFSTTSTLGPKNAARKISATRTASTWNGSGVLTIAAAAGLLGWSWATYRVQGFPGAMLLDSKVSSPKYASMRDMELVGNFVLTLRS